MKLKLYLVKNGISITQFSEKLGVSRKYLNQVALGHMTPSKPLAKLIELETNGEVTAEELLKGNE